MTERVGSLTQQQPAMVIGLIGGTGDQGRGLATRWAAAGREVLIGSRDASRAREVARCIPGNISGADNRATASRADIVVLAVPWSAHEATLVDLRESLSGRTVVDCVNPLGFDQRGPYPLAVPQGSAVEQAALLLPDSHVVGAFHHLSAVRLLDTTQPVDCDVMVVGEDRQAVDEVIELANLIPGVHGVYAGRHRNARQVEALTANLIAINRRYRTHSGVRVTGLETGSST